LIGTKYIITINIKDIIRYITKAFYEHNLIVSFYIIPPLKIQVANLQEL